MLCEKKSSVVTKAVIFSMSFSGIADLVKTILDLDASINFYMFHGGTNFGFMNGANVLPGEGQTYTYAADVTSYGKK